MASRKEIADQLSALRAALSGTAEGLSIDQLAAAVQLGVDLRTLHSAGSRR